MTQRESYNIWKEKQMKLIKAFPKRYLSAEKFEKYASGKICIDKRLMLPKDNRGSFHQTAQLYVVYRIICIPTGIGYIGSTSNIKKRMQVHFSELKNGKHYNSQLQEHFNRFGKSNFECEVLRKGICKSMRFQIENEYIAKIRRTYNIYPNQ